MRNLLGGGRRELTSRGSEDLSEYDCLRSRAVAYAGAGGECRDRAQKRAGPPRQRRQAPAAPQRAVTLDRVVAIVNDEAITQYELDDARQRRRCSR